MSAGTMAFYVARRTPWRQLVAAGALCAPILAAGAVTARSELDVLPFMRMTALVLAAAAVLAVEDPATSVTAPTIVGRLRLRVCACAATAVPLCCVWGLLLATAHALASTPQRLPAGGLLLELLAMAAAGWSISVSMAHVAGARFVAARAAGVLVMGVAATLTTPRLIRWFWVGPGSEWHRSHMRWALVGTVSLVLFVRMSLDPARVRRVFAVRNVRRGLES